MDYDFAEKILTEEQAFKLREIGLEKKCVKCDGIGSIITKKTKGQNDKYIVCECILQKLLWMASDIPEKYGKEMELSENLKKEINDFKKIIGLIGSSYLKKLFAFRVASKFINEGKFVRYVITKTKSDVRFDYENNNKREMLDNDILSITKADLIVFEDELGGQSAVEYQAAIRKRISEGKYTIFLGETKLIEKEDYTTFWIVKINENDIKFTKK